VAPSVSAPKQRFPENDSPPQREEESGERAGAHSPPPTTDVPSLIKEGFVFHGSAPPVGDGARANTSEHVTRECMGPVIHTLLQLALSVGGMAGKPAGGGALSRADHEVARTRSRFAAPWRVSGRLLSDIRSLGSLCVTRLSGLRRKDEEIYDEGRHLVFRGEECDVSH